MRVALTLSTALFLSACSEQDEPVEFSTEQTTETGTTSSETSTTSSETTETTTGTTSTEAACDFGDIEGLWVGPFAGGTFAGLELDFAATAGLGDVIGSNRIEVYGVGECLFEMTCERDLEPGVHVVWNEVVAEVGIGCIPGYYTLTLAGDELAVTYYDSMSNPPQDTHYLTRVSP